MKGLCLLFFPNVPGATFIQGATLIPESRVLVVVTNAGIVCFFQTFAVQKFWLVTLESGISVAP